VKKVITVVGTRPEAIKMGPVMRELAARDGIVSKVVVTAQHREMLDQALGLFDLRPDHDLDLMRTSQHPLEVITGAIDGLAAIYKTEKPDFVLVQGDTSTTFAGAMAGFYLHCPVGHVEAGLRSHDRQQPFPEEINRRLTSVVADWHFAPTQKSCDNLLAEGIPRDRVMVTGNTVVDALRYILAAREPDWPAALKERLSDGRRLILVTVHRRENWGKVLEGICTAVRAIALARPELAIALPVHPNPAVSETVRRILGGIDNILLLPPIDYVNFAHLLDRTYLALTDSGGVQEETVVLGRPGLVLRNVTERPEGVETGGLKLIGTDPARIQAEVASLLDDEAAYAAMQNAANPYGDGTAARRIVDFVAGLPG